MQMPANRLTTVSQNMTNIDEGKNLLIEQLSQQYSHSAIGMDEYERLLEYIGKIETVRELAVIEKVIRENDNRAGTIWAPDKDTEKRRADISRVSSNLKTDNKKKEKYTCVFSTRKIVIDALPIRKNTIHIECVFGTMLITVPPGTKVVSDVTSVFSTVSAPPEIIDDDVNVPELYIKGDAVFSNIVIKQKQTRRGIGALIGTILNSVTISA